MASLTLEHVLQWCKVLTPPVFEQMGGEVTTDNRLKHIQKVYISPSTYRNYKDLIELKVFPVTFCKQSILLASSEQNISGTFCPALPCHVLCTKPETQHERHLRHFCYTA